ncbi:hypothetical protein BDN72DRAFT_850429 [Pluteus cervinus]|uniref:Uncharacterized protein n=1 Tax=Pluteus cervinus TaxID=181527 RepID=A0ACD3A401_9AGAR|nr:hypothetical protein BDN72DRAFT_850429 [Pluteus cervinus]
MTLNTFGRPNGRLNTAGARERVKVEPQSPSTAYDHDLENYAEYDTYQTPYNGCTLICDRDNFSSRTPSAPSDSHFASPGRIPSLPGSSESGHGPSQRDYSKTPYGPRYPGQPQRSLTTPRASITSPQRRKQEARFACSIPGCTINSTKGSDLQGHLSTHTEKPFQRHSSIFDQIPHSHANTTPYWNPPRQVEGPGIPVARTVNNNGGGGSNGHPAPPVSCDEMIACDNRAAIRDWFQLACLSLLAFLIAAS